MKTVNDVLSGARGLLADETKWCRDHVARRGDGELASSAVDPAAAKWSLVGAMQKACAGDQGGDAQPGGAAPECYTRAYRRVEMALRMMREAGKLRPELASNADKASWLVFPSHFERHPAVTHADVLKVIDVALSLPEL
jgi:hypothetical protein